MKRIFGLLNMLLLSALLTACSGPSGNGALPNPNPDPDPDPIPGDEAVELTCETFGFACSPGEVPDAVLERSSLLHIEAQARLTNSESFASVQGWLESQSDMRLVLTGDHALGFILDKGILMVLYDATAATGRDQADVDTLIIEPQDVVGRGTPRDNPGKKKNALILSPFEFEYQTPDAGSSVWGILSGISDYQGGGSAQYFKNDDVTVDKFGIWNQYDVILYNGHGGTLEATDTRTGHKVETSFLMTGVQVDSCDSPEVKAAGAGVSCGGVSIRYANIVGKARDEYRDFLIILPSYLATSYPNGLEKSVLVLNGCSTGVSTALPNRLAGNSSVVLGWSDAVLANFNPGVMTRLFQLLALGMTTEKALEKTCQQGGCTDTTGKDATLRRFAGGNDLRIREIPEFIHPTRGTLLQPNDTLSIIGAAGDGEDDSLDFVIDVAGVPEDDSGPVVSSGLSPSSTTDYFVRVYVDDVELGGDFLLRPIHGKSRRMDEHTVRLTLEEVDLRFDVPEEGKEVELKVVVDLPEGGQSIKVERVRLEGNRCRWELRSDKGAYDGLIAVYSYWEGYEATSMMLANENETDSHSLIITLFLLYEPSEGQNPMEDSRLSIVSPDWILTSDEGPANLTFFVTSMSDEHIEGTISGTLWELTYPETLREVSMNLYFYAVNADVYGFGVCGG
jgi:hypothetical protein